MKGNEKKRNKKNFEETDTDELDENEAFLDDDLDEDKDEEIEKDEEW